ncbi:MAG: hypothetical protein IKQ71_10280 [Lachnospiraceae bacterium]|nr:hypothetical protein [Lachnospiraceae bacterium]
MMDYTMFKELVNDKFMEYMPDHMKNGELKIMQVNKTNGTKDGLNVYQPDSNVAPTLYVDDLYEQFKETEDFEGVLKSAAEKYVNAMENVPQMPKDILTDSSKDKIYMTIINTEANRQMLEKVPHREVNDTSVIYRLMISSDERGIGSTVITDDLAKNLELSEEELFKIAAENTPKMFPPVVKPMSQVIFGILTEDGGMPKDVAEQVVDGMKGENEMMWIITNNKGVSGAVNMIFEKNLFELSKGLNDDLYILPSSIHEVIAVPSSLGDPVELAEMVQQVNMDVVDVSERLSNQVYHYNRDLRKLSMATDTPNKDIVNAVAEISLVYDSEPKR